MRKLLLITFILFLFGEIYAQENLPPVYEIRVDTPVQKIPESYWQFLVDSNGKMGIDDVSATQFSSRFKAYNNEGIGFLGFNHAWIRLRLKNTTGKDVTMIFRNFPPADRYEVHVLRENGKSDSLVTGSYVPLSQRDGLKPNVAIPVYLKNGEQVTVYRKIFIKYLDPIPVAFIGFSFLDSYVDEIYVKAPWYTGDVRNWLIAGILFFGFFFNLFFFLIDRDRVYLYMSLLLLVEGVWYLTSNRTITFRESHVFKEYIDMFLSHCLFFVLVTQFVRHFLKTRQYYPRWDKYLVVFAVLMVTSAVTNFFLLNTPFSKSTWPVARFIVASLFFLLMVSLFYSFLFLRRERDRLTKLSVIAATPALFMWSFIYFSGNAFRFLNEKFAMKTPRFFIWLEDNEMVIEMFFIAWFAILFTWILLQRYSLLRKQYVQQALEREKEKTELVNQQKDLLEKQVEERTAALRKSLEDLKSTQSQLVHSEKMASLGEMTAGIAHEIQNPLNFVNNFSEVNKELISEMQQEIDTENLQEVKKIAGNISENEEKIIFHGKRADAIVKSMLQHSRTSTGKKEPVDINALADEYLRLAYHGLRAKDKTFNAKFETELDPSLEPVNAVRQDIGRVILNLISNAFYSVNDRKKQLADGYDPAVKVQTKNLGDKVSITVKDNGSGIPTKVLDKIFQPFFTTKPAGEGTGLGLSLSYDIITKGHAGQLRVETKENEGSAFIIELPKHG